MANLAEDDFLGTVPEEDLFDGWDDDVTMPEQIDDEETVEVSADENEQPATEGETPEEEVTEEANTEDDGNADPQTDDGNVEEAETTDVAEAPEEKPETNDADRKFVLKHLDDVREVTFDEMQAMAQKGWDYDRIRSERDSLKNELPKLKFLEEALDAIKGEFGSGYDLLDDAMATALIESEANNGRVIDRVEAVRRVKANREGVFNAAAEAAQKAKADAYQRFVEAYPTLDPKTIPMSVFDEFEETSDLLGAYQKFENSTKANSLADENKALTEKVAALEKELATIKQNQKNAARSLGSRKTVGSTPKVDPMFEGWDDD